MNKTSVRFRGKTLTTICAVHDAIEKLAIEGQRDMSALRAPGRITYASYDDVLSALAEIEGLVFVAVEMGQAMEDSLGRYRDRVNELEEELERAEEFYKETQ